MVFTNTFIFVWLFFGAFTNCKSLAFFVILPAAVYILQHPPHQNDWLIFNSVNRPVNSTYTANVFNKFLTNFLTNFFVNVIDISMNSNTIVCGKIVFGKDSCHIETSQLICSVDQLAGLCMVRVFEKKRFSNNLLCKRLLQYFVIHSKIKGYWNFKKLLKSENVNRSDLRNSVYLWLYSSILQSHVYLKHRRDFRLKYTFMPIIIYSLSVRIQKEPSDINYSY